jgi:RimJ/RimL family protein N-acetyltransferase
MQLRHENPLYHPELQLIAKKSHTCVNGSNAEKAGFHFEGRVDLSLGPLQVLIYKTSLQ